MCLTCGCMRAHLELASIAAPPADGLAVTHPSLIRYTVPWASVT